MLPIEKLSEFRPSILAAYKPSELSDNLVSRRQNLAERIMKSVPPGD